MVSASVFVPDLGIYTFASTSNLVSDVQQWVGDPATNFGWIMMSEAEGVAFTVRRIGTRESGTNAPRLTVNFKLPEAPVLQLARIEGGVQLRFAALAGQAYTVESRDSLITGLWQTLTNITPVNTATNIILTLPGMQSTRFFRVGVF